MNTTIYNKMAERLTQVFNNAAMLEDYQNPGNLSECFGWDGRGMSPISRTAFISTYGRDMVEAAEKEARRRIDENERQYNESHHARAMEEAQAAESEHKAPAVGSHVLAVHSGLKCDDGRGIYGEIATAATYCAEDMERKTPQLCKVVEVYEVSAEEFARPSLADDLVMKAHEEGREFPGGAQLADEDEERADLFDNYRFWITLAAAVVCRDSGRWFLIDSEGYNYARYCLMSTNWREMFADEVAEEVRRDQEKKEEAARIEAEEKAARYEDYKNRCAKYAGIMEDVKPYEEAEREAQRKQYAEGSANGYRTKEYKAAQKETRAASSALMAARKRNLVAMASHIFPGIKAKAVKSSKYYGGFDLVYFDGPRLERFNDATDYDLFIEGWTGSDYSDGTTFNKVEFGEFAAQYMAMGYNDIETAREWSAETRARLLSAVCKAVEGAENFDYNNRHEWTAEELRKVAELSGANASYLLTEWETTAQYYNYIDAEAVARWCFESMDFDIIAPEPKKKAAESREDSGRADTKAGAEEPATSEENAPADGLELVEIAEGLAVVGDSRTTYKNRKAIKAHGCKWNKTAQQWEATTAEDCETLRRWFALREQTNDQTGETAEEEPAAALPEWLEVGTRFALVDFITGEPSGVVYTCTAINKEARTIETAEASDSVTGSHVFPWGSWNWPQFAPITPAPALPEKTPAEMTEEERRDFISDLFINRVKSGLNSLQNMPLCAEFINKLKAEGGEELAAAFRSLVAFSVMADPEKTEAQILGDIYAKLSAKTA